MTEVGKRLTGKKLAAIVIAAIIIIAAVVGAYWYFFLRPSAGFRITVTQSVKQQNVEETGGYTELGEDVTLSGSGAPAGSEVTLTYTMPDSNLSRVLTGPIRPTFTRPVTAGDDGKFTDTFTPNMTGRWDVTASTGEATTDPVTFYIFVSDKPIKIGVIGPLEWIQGIGMREGAIMAAEKINDAGGILGRKVVIKTGDEGTVPERGTAEMARLCAEEKVQAIIGGFRTEIVYPMREKAMDYRIPFFIAGAATPWLIDCVTTTTAPHRWPCGECVRCDYERYKYLFRVMPTNTDVLFSGFLVPYLRNYLIPNVIQPALVEAGKLDDNVTEGEPGYDPAYPNMPEKVKVSLVIENLDWTAELRVKTNAIGPAFFGPERSQIVSLVGGNLYYAVSPLTKDFTPILQEIKDSGTNLIFEVFSGEEGLAFIKQWRDMNVPAIPVGINVLSQESEMWDWTGGRCEYEAFLSTMGTRTPVVPGLTEKFWDEYTSRWGHAPIYTSFGAYEGVMGTAYTTEQAALDHPELELTDPATYQAKYEDRTLYDILIPYIENMDRLGILGRSKFTNTHDIYTGGWKALEYGVEYYTKPLCVQWRKTAEGGRMAAVSAGEGSHVAPAWAPYIEEFQIPPWMLE